MAKNDKIATRISPAADGVPVSNGNGVGGGVLSTTGPELPGAAATPPSSRGQVTQSQQPQIDLASEEALYKALASRRDPAAIKLVDAEHDALVNHIIHDFEDADTGNREFKRNMTDMLANWRGVTQPKSFPFENCANIVVPLTSVLVETMKARIRKAVMGGEFVAKASYIDKQVPTEELDEFNRWYKWELDEVVELDQWFGHALHNILLYGLDTTIPCYHHETRFLHSSKTWQLDENQQLSKLVEQGIQSIVNEPSTWGDEPLLLVTGQPRPGEFSLSDDGRVAFSLNVEKGELKADIWRRETIFDGVRANQVQLEDLVLFNTHHDIDKLPFVGVRLWYTADEYRQGLEDGFFIDYGEVINQEIIASSDDTKVSDEIDQPQTRLQDAETGTDSLGMSSSNHNHRYIEVYRWEGWWVWDKTGDDYGIDKLLQPATQVAVWVGVRSKKILKIARLEDLNKDGKRSIVKMPFLEEPSRFYPMGLAEWVHHSQDELDAVHNQRLDAGLLYNVPFGFYKPAAGIAKGAEPIKMEPGKFFPVADPQGINMPRSNWQPTVAFAEEQLIVRYANLQAGLTDPALGQPVSKRQSASEYVGNANAIDTRSEDVIRGIVRSLRVMLLRILGLYEQFGPRTRIFRIGGEGGVTVTKRFDRDRLHGKIVLTMLANLQQLNEELQKKIALDMLQILLNQLLIQSGITGPDTIYEAVNTLAKLMKYEGVPIHKPDVPPMSDPPDVEEHQMFAGQKPFGPTLSENINEHMHHHSMTAADSELMNKWPAASRQLLAQHMQDTMKAGQAKQIEAQNRAALAVQMRQEMEAKGIRPGKAGQEQPSENLGPGTAQEGVAGEAGGGGTAPTPTLQ